MHPLKENPELKRGWYTGPWISNLEISIGFAHTGIDEPDLHSKTYEVYMIARGEAQIRIETQTHKVTEGDILVVYPGEAYTSKSNSPEYFHFVIRVPDLSSEEAMGDRIPVTMERLRI